MLAERGIDVSYERVRRWDLKYGAMPLEISSRSDRVKARWPPPTWRAGMHWRRSIARRRQPGRPNPAGPKGSAGQCCNPTLVQRITAMGLQDRYSSTAEFVNVLQQDSKAWQAYVAENPIAK